MSVLVSFNRRHDLVETGACLKVRQTAFARAWLICSVHFAAGCEAESRGARLEGCVLVMEIRLRGMVVLFLANGHVSNRVLTRNLPLAFFFYAGDPFRLELIVWRGKDKSSLSVVPILLAIVPLH